MRRSFLVPLLLTVAMGGQSGCAILLFPTEPSPSTQAVSQESFSPQPSAMAPGDLSKIEPGHYAKFLLPRMQPGLKGQPSLQWIGGRVVAIDADEIVLNECVVPAEMSTVPRKTILERVPYYNRLFKVTGYGVTPTSIPGELRLPKSSIACAASIPDSEWTSFLEPHFERIGIDFDGEVMRNSCQ